MIVKLWTCKDSKFELTKELGKHDDWIRDVAWCNNIGLMHDTIATCGEDQKVKIWKREHIEGQDQLTWSTKDISFSTPIWKVSFSNVGSMLAVSGGDNQIMIYKENTAGEWETVSKVNDEGKIEEQ
jgi:protein transport protein SEC13